MKRIVSFVMAVGMALSLAACGGAASSTASTSTSAPAASSAAAADSGEILIGCLQDITGNTSGLGLSVQKGAQAAVDEINANGGINGKKIVMNTYDTKGDVTEAVNSYITAVTVDQVSLIVGPPVANIANAIKEAKAGKIEYRLDKTNIIHCPIGKVSFGAEKLTENYNALIGAIIKAKPAAAKGQYIKSCVTASTMGPGIKIVTKI